MKPKRFIFRSTPLFGAPLRYGAPVFAGLAVILSGFDADARDILRGPAAASGSAPAPGSGGALDRAATDAARANAKDILLRTGQSLDAVRAMQNAARAVALNGPDNLGTAAAPLPNVPNGLGIGGLNPVADAATNITRWSGANQPVETSTGGNVNVTVKQTTQQALLHWQTLNVGKNTTLTFDQSAGGGNAGQWIAFNRVTDPTGNPTQILGNIKADGQIYLINRNGVIFGGSSVVNARGLTVSSLPVNERLLANGLLNNSDREFLFSDLDFTGDAGAGSGSPLTVKGRPGDVTVRSGAKISTPVSEDGNGGRIMLVGPNVINEGDLSSPSGQVILAAGLQVGIAAHLASDPSLRGLDVFVGAVTDPTSVIEPYAGSVKQDGLLEVARGNAWLAGKSIYQNGVIDSTTSVSLNGRVDLTANYDAVPNVAATSDEDPTFVFKSTGSITLGNNSVIQVLPELASKATTVGTELTLRSRINLQGKSIYLAPGSTILAPGGLVGLKAGNWVYNSSLLTSSFVSTGGQVYLDSGSVINLAGTAGASASVLDNLLTLELRGTELAPAPLQRDGKLRGASITVDLRKSGTLDGRDWVGTPLADLTGYVALIQRSVGQLTTAGGSLDISAGGSVVVRAGSVLDVSGGWTDFQGGKVRTSRVFSNGHIVDIGDAAPDQVYQGFFSGTSTFSNAKWGVSETFIHALAPIGAYYQRAYMQGADAGSISISAPSMALDGRLLGAAVAGETQLRSSQSSSKLARSGSLALSFNAQDPVTNGYPVNFPAPPDIIVADGPRQTVADFATDVDGVPLELAADRVKTVHLSPSLVSEQGFGNLVIKNEGGAITLPESTNLAVPVAGTLTFRAGRIEILGSISAPGGSLGFQALNLSPHDVALLSPEDPLPEPAAGRGIFKLGENGRLSTAGLLSDDRAHRAGDPFSPIALHGGKIAISAFTADLRGGGVIDVSGGFAISPKGVGVYGNGGSISIKAGQDITLPQLIGGGLTLASTLAGHSGAKAGSLALQAPTVQIGGVSSRADTLLVRPEFFSQGGFGDFTLTGLGVFGDLSVPAVLVAEDTRIRPEAENLSANFNPSGPAPLSLDVVRNQPNERPPVSLHLSAPGVSDAGGLIVRGDVVVEKGALIQADPGGSVSIAGNTVAVLGSIIAPGGSISVTGGSNSIPIFGTLDQALVTTYLGAASTLSTAGVTVLGFDPYGRRIGSVLNGGSLTLSGNIVAATGATLDVSGSSGWLDVSASRLASAPSGIVPASRGVTSPLDRLSFVSTLLESNGGNITLKGGQMLFSGATLLGRAGGDSALGGSLAVSSGRFYELGVSPLPTDVSLVVSPEYPGITTVLPDDRSVIGMAVRGAGSTADSPTGGFGVNSFTQGGFGSLSLRGVIRFDGPVSISAGRTLEIATGGILFADSAVNLSAPLVVLGRPFADPMPVEDKTSPYQLNGLPFAVPPTHGTGSLNVAAKQIDAGGLSLQGIGNAFLTADNGDIRGNGTLAISGSLDLRAGQIYPTTASEFSLQAYDYESKGVQNGTISFHSSGSRRLPLAAGGNLGVYASIIRQAGVLRAPLGTITLGWDGTGNAPLNLLTGNKIPSPVTKELYLEAGGTTSVSAVDPLNGKGVTIPYGISPDGNSWIDPRGVDITASGPPGKAITLAAGSITTDPDSSIDLRGGGDLYAYRWVKGLGGPTDILASTRSFAVIPGDDSLTALKSPFNSSTASTNLIADDGPGYVNDSLKEGDRIYLNQSGSLAAGTYTLLPARYALLPGAFLISPSGDKGVTAVEMPDKSSLVSGYRYNGLDAGLGRQVLSSRFEVLGSSVLRKRAEYQDFLANGFLSERSKNLNLPTPVLPKDSADLLFQAAQSLVLQGSVWSKSVANGAGSSISISSTRDILIAGQGSVTSPGTITLDAGVLNSFGAETLLIGGTRKKGIAGTTVTVNSGSITVDNAGTPLTAGDLLLVAKNNLELKSGSDFGSTGVLSRPAESVSIFGNGVLARASADVSATSIRSGVSGSSARLTVDSSARIAGGSITLDSSSDMRLSPDADLSASAYALSAGRISIRLNQPGEAGGNSGLILEGGVLRDLWNSSAVSLLSYSSIDIYGNGGIGGRNLSNLTLNAGAIRGFNAADGVAGIEAGLIVLGNAVGVTDGGSAGLGAGSLEFRANKIRLGSNRIDIRNYENVRLEASAQISGSGVGTLSTTGNLTAMTPLITGESKSNHTISTSGVLTLGGIAGAAVTAANEGSGSSLSLTGSSVNVDTLVRLPGGSLNLNATKGDLAIGGRLDVSGSVRGFYDVAKFTDAGEISLSADSGNVILSAGSAVDVSAHQAGGNAGTLRVSAPAGLFSLNGSLSGAGSAGGRNGVFELDTKSLTNLSSLSQYLADASLTQSQTIRVRNGSVLVDGVSITRHFLLSADQGSINVTGTIDASGTTGGSIRLVANGDVILSDGSKLTAAGRDFSAAGKGGAVTLEAGSLLNGVVGTGKVSIKPGALVDLSVASWVAGDAQTFGSSASKGQFSGKLHLRAPRVSGVTGLSVDAIGGDITGASSILVEGYRLYDLTSSGGTITAANRTSIQNDANAFLGAAGTTTAAYTAIINRLLSNNPGLASSLVLAPGVEIINRTGDLTLGSASASVANDWDLSGFRFGPKSAPGVLTMRASGNLNFFSALSDGFTPTLAANNATRLWLARPTVYNPLLPTNSQSWSYRLTSGADQSAVDFGRVKTIGTLSETSGFLKLGNNRTNLATSTGPNATTTSAIASTTTAASNGYQVVRTGSGDIEIHAGRSVQLLNQFATIYTTGTRLEIPTLGGLFDLPSLSQNGMDSSLGAVQQSFPALFTMAGGNVGIFAGANIEHLTRNASNGLVADSQLQLPNNWLHRRGYVDPLTGEWGINRWNESASTAWWIDFSNFFQGIGALGGGDVTLSAAGNISNVDAVIPTNARMTGYTDTTRLHLANPSNSVLFEIGGGNLTVSAGGNIDAGVYYVERGHGKLSAGGEILTNATRSVISSGQRSVNTQLPTTLFLGKGGFDVIARGDVLLGPVANPFLLPGALNNSFWQKSYFSSYASDSFVNVTSAGGGITLRVGSTAPGQAAGVSDPLLQSWITNKLWLSNISASSAKPWLRLSENKTSPFETLVSLLPGTLRATAFGGDINLVGNLTLVPSPTGTLELLSSGGINGLQPNGTVTIQSQSVTTWGTASINLSDASPSAIPGIRSPFGYQTIAGVNPNAASLTNTELKFLDFIDRLFVESGITNAVMGTKQALHAPGLLHLNDPTPLRLYAETGDVSGFTLFSPKAARVLAGRDIQDVSFYLQNLRTGDASLVSSGRDMVLSQLNSPLRIASQLSGNTVNFDSGPLAGDIQISGPGTLTVLAGRELDLGTGSGNSDGTGVGITSVGNVRNPSLGTQGANLVIAAGTGSASSLAGSDFGFSAFITKFVKTPQGVKYLKEIAPNVDFAKQDDEEQARLALEVFYRILRDAGRAYSKKGNYDTATTAIKTLFGTGEWFGEILTRSRDIRTASGGDIGILAPGGGLAMSNTTIGNPLSPPGIITSGGGGVSVFAHDDITIGIGRIFTLRGGNEILWSSKGDIAAGSSSKNVKSAPPTRVLIDPQSAWVQTDLAGLATGGGIGVLATVAGVTPGDVDLIAPEGSVDAGDAGIRVSGNLNISATQVLNAGNISVSGSSAGTPSVTSISVNVGGLTSASSAAAAATATAAVSQPTRPTAEEGRTAEDAPSMFTVEVIGYGGGSGDEDDEKVDDSE